MSFPYPLPDNEGSRLEALHALKVLDTPQEREFDRLTLLAAQIMEAPIALISLVDEDRQWFKSKQGLNADQTCRSQAFCAHAIVDDAIMLVRDARKDERFADNPLVTGSPHIRSYVGVPLKISSQHPVGTLCVISQRETYPTRTQRRQLQSLAAICVDFLEMRAALGENWPRPLPHEVKSA